MTDTSQEKNSNISKDEEKRDKERIILNGKLYEEVCPEVVNWMCEVPPPYLIPRSDNG